MSMVVQCHVVQIPKTLWCLKMCNFILEKNILFTNWHLKIDFENVYMSLIFKVQWIAVDWLSFKLPESALLH